MYIHRSAAFALSVAVSSVAIAQPCTQTCTALAVRALANSDSPGTVLRVRGSAQVFAVGSWCECFGSTPGMCDFSETFSNSFDSNAPGGFSGELCVRAQSYDQEPFSQSKYARSAACINNTLVRSSDLNSIFVSEDGETLNNRLRTSYASLELCHYRLPGAGSSIPCAPCGNATGNAQSAVVFDVTGLIGWNIAVGFVDFGGFSEFVGAGETYFMAAVRVFDANGNRQTRTWTGKRLGGAISGSIATPSSWNSNQYGGTVTLTTSIRGFKLNEIDYRGNGCFDLFDIAFLESNFLGNPGPADKIWDFNSNGIVDSADIDILRAGYFDGRENGLFCATPCSPCDIATSQSAPGADGNLDEGDYNLFFSGFFDSLSFCDIADDSGAPLPPFGSGGGVNNGVTEADYNLFVSLYFDGCPQ
jgi:hypothetical protein